MTKKKPAHACFDIQPPRTRRHQVGRFEALFTELGAEIQQREDSRIAVVLFGQVKVFHRPHPSPDTDKGAVASVRKWLEENGKP